MRMVVITHKVCWRSCNSPSGYATDGGFPFQMHALASISDELVLCAPIRVDGNTDGEVAIGAKNLRVVGLPVPPGHGIVRKVLLPFWVALVLSRLIAEVRKADVVHAPIPGD